MNLEEIGKAVARETGLPSDRIGFSWRKLGEKGWDEILILLRNPYGGEEGM